MALNQAYRTKRSSRNTQQQGTAAQTLQQNQQASNANLGYQPPVVDPPKDEYRPPLVAPPVQAQQPQSYSQIRAQEPAPLQPAPQEPSLGTRSYQTFEEFSQPFMSGLDSRAAARQARSASRAYNKAYDAQILAANQLADTNRLQAQQDRDYALGVAQKGFADNSKQLEESYDPKLIATKQFLSDRGILDSSASGEKLTKLLTDQQDSVKRLQDNLATTQKQITDSYNNRAALIQQQTQQAVADQQNLLAQRLDALAKDQRVSEESKAQFQYQIYQDYQKQIDALAQGEQQAQQAAYEQQQQDFENAISLANVTGIYEGNPTLKAQQEAFDQDLALAKFNDSQKSGGGGGGSGGTASTSNPRVQSALQQAQLLVRQGLTPVDAIAMVGGQLTAAEKRALQAAFTEGVSSQGQSIIDAFRLGTAGGNGVGLGNLLSGLSAANNYASNNSLFSINPNNLKTDQLKATLAQKQSNGSRL